MNKVLKTVYHGSNAIFDKFDAGKARIFDDNYGGSPIAYFTDNKLLAIQYAKAMSKKMGQPIVYECNLNLKNCFDLKDKFSGKVLIDLLKGQNIEQFARNASLLNYGSDKFKVIRMLTNGELELSGMQIFKGLSGTIKTLKAREILIKNGYDGLRYDGPNGVSVYLPYKESSVKIIKQHKIEKLKETK